MKAILILPIRLYRIVVPVRFRPECLYEETCSVHVERIAREGGLLAGMKALGSRFRNCRPGYRGVRDQSSKKWKLLLAGGESIDADDVALKLRKLMDI
jgi:putative component of membrane protein insertase Oxa1/YidC/SpoIIIJ protein YidD